MEEQQRFSDRLEKWLGSDGPKTVDGITEVFGEKSFAVAFAILMALPALPLPTGGLTHIFEVIVMLLALEMIAMRTTPWLPQKLASRELPSGEKLSNQLVRRIRWFEKFTRRRFPRAIGSRGARPLVGLAVLVLTLGAFVAPPFSGLDTLPAMGVVLISLAVIFEDSAVLIAGALVGVAGISLEFILGKATFDAALHLF
jgi:hypothetical protein